MLPIELSEDFEDLSSAEDFLDYFEIDYDQKVVHINRLHIMQRFHDYLQQADKDENTVIDAELCSKMLEQAYIDFVESDALSEKVFKVFKMHEPQTTFVSVDDLLG